MVRPMLASDRGTQPALLPVDVRDLLPADHMAWAILAVVDEFDLDRFHAAYRSDGRGHPPYDPAMMVALILYCATKNIRGGRAIEAACVDDLGCRVITGNKRPDHSTISQFIKDHGLALRALLPQSLRLCDDAGLIDLSVIAGDGTKVQANAAMGATVDADTLQQQITDLKQQIAEVEAQWRATVAEPTDTPPLFDLDPPATTPPVTPATTTPPAAPVLTPDQAWLKLTTLTRTLHAREAALTHLATRPTTDHTEWQAKLARDTARVTRCREHLTTTRDRIDTAYQYRQQAAASGIKFRGAPPVPPEQHSHVRAAAKALATATARAETTAANPPTTGKVNTTDPGSRIMPTKQGGYDQLYNLQATATARQIILAATIHDSPNDKKALTGVLDSTQSNLHAASITRPIGVALFDSGYASTENFIANLPIDLLLVAVEREARQTGRLNDDQTTAAHTWHDMATRLADPANHALYKRRGAIIEPVFAQLFNHFGHNLHLRGTHQVETELHIWATSHNLGKLIRHRRATRAKRGTHPPG
jgi:transposase